MLMSESLEIAEMLKAAAPIGTARVLDRALPKPSTRSAARPRTVRTRSSTLLEQKAVDLMIVIGGYNSSNTCNLARICAASKPTFHIADPECLVSPEEIRHRPAGRRGEVTARGWLPVVGSRGRRPDVRRLDTGQSGRPCHR